MDIRTLPEAVDSVAAVDGTTVVTVAAVIGAIDLRFVGTVMRCRYSCLLIVLVKFVA